MEREEIQTVVDSIDPRFDDKRGSFEQINNRIGSPIYDVSRHMSPKSPATPQMKPSSKQNLDQMDCPLIKKKHDS